jgi:hypothetical protein
MMITRVLGGEIHVSNCWIICRLLEANTTCVTLLILFFVLLRVFSPQIMDFPLLLSSSKSFLHF